MSYLLQFPAAAAYVVTGRLILGSSYTITFELQRDSNVDIYLTSDGGDELRYIVGTGWQIRFGGGYFSYPEAELIPPIGEKFTVTHARDGSTSNRSFQINSGTTVTKATSAVNLWFNNIGQGFGGVYQAFKLYKCTVTNPSNTTYNRVFDADASGGTGTILPNTLTGTNNGVLTGAWPSDNSEWVFYSSGGAFTLNADGGAFAYTGAAASLLASRRLSANGGSFSYSGASATLRVNRLLQADGASFSYSGSSTDLLLNRLLSADGGLFSYSGAAATLTYTPITGYVLSADGATFNYVCADAALNYSQNFPQANPKDFTVSSLVDGSFAYTSSISPTVGFSAMISSTFKFNGSLN